MADAEQAIRYVLRQEDATLSGVITNRRDEDLSPGTPSMDVSLLNALRLQEIRFHVSLKQPSNLAGWINRDLA